MKKLICLLLVLAALLCLAACGQPKNEGEPDDRYDPEGKDVPDYVPGGDMLAGGWAAAEDAALNDEQLALFEKAMEGLLGVDYLPIAYLGSQVVSGMNHAYLCQAQIVSPDAQPYYAIVYLYADLNGGVSILNIAPFSVDSDGVAPAADPDEALLGGWTATHEPDVLTDDLDGIEKALEGLVGVSYEPVAHLASQIVSGVNSAYLCRAKVISPDARPYYAIVSTYTATDGSWTLLNIADFDFGALCTYGG